MNENESASWFTTSLCKLLKKPVRFSAIFMWLWKKSRKWQRNDCPIYEWYLEQKYESIKLSFGQCQSISIKTANVEKVLKRFGCEILEYFDLC